MPNHSSAASAFLVLAFLTAGCTRDEQPPRHVFLITVDTLRADHLGAYGYPRDTSPAFDRLADGGVLFERAFAQWPKTGTSFASLFTGQHPQSTGLTHDAAIRVPEEYLTLPELMQHVGFTTAAVVSNGVLSRELGWDRGFGEYLETWKLAPEPSEDPVEYRKWLNARRVNELAVPLLEQHRDTERLFVWLHYSDPHAPYLLPQDVDNPFLGDPHDTGDGEVDPKKIGYAALGGRRELPYYVAQYDANVHFTDLHIGKILDHARRLGLLRDALVVFTADHGESLGEHGYYFGHGRLPYNDGVHVPLAFSLPGSLPEGQRIGAPVELVDLYPTLRELLAPDREVPGLEGESLLPLLRPGSGSPEQLEQAFRLAFSQAGGGSPTTHFRSVQDRRWKLIYHPAQGGGRRQARPASYELYHLADDPAETRDLSAEETSELRRLRQELLAWMKGSDWIRRPRSEIEAHSEETLKALRALGYIQ